MKENAVESDQAETPKWLRKRIRKFTHLTQKQIFDAFPYQRGWKKGQHFDGFGAEWDVEVFVFVNHPFSQNLAALKKCADFQARGGSCVMICPSISLVKCDLYNNCLKYTTV